MSDPTPRPRTVPEIVAEVIGGGRPGYDELLYAVRVLDAVARLPMAPQAETDRNPIDRRPAGEVQGE